jgi:hypothetical protein
MSKPSLRPTREARKVISAKDRRRAQSELAEKRAKLGFKNKSHTTNSSGKCKYKTVEEEISARNEITFEHLGILRACIQHLIQKCSKIKDIRNPKKSKYKMWVILLYGILSFVLQMSSARQITKKMTRPAFWENLVLLFPELGDNPEAPHHITLARLLAGMDVNEISNFHQELIRKWIKSKKFRRFLVNNRYLVAVDGTQKMCRDQLWDVECLDRTFNRGEENEKTQHYVYVLQAILTLSDGMSIPLMTEFLSYSEGDSDRDKQDCELKAFYRLAERIKKAFPHLPIMLLLDGLYPKGPVFEICSKNKWQYMIVLKDNALKQVMTEFEAISGLEPGDRYSRIWGNRNQDFKWANNIAYWYGSNEKKCKILNVVECLETWEEIEQGGTNTVEKNSRHVWISSEPLDRWNLHRLCNLSARARWTIESSFQVEKNDGYEFEHCFSYNWNTMKGYHYLMQLGHMFNVMAKCSKLILAAVKELGMQGLIEFVRGSIAGQFIKRDLIADLLELSIPGSSG